MPERTPYERPAPVHRPGVIAVAVGVLRYVLMAPLLALGTVAVLLAAAVPVRIRGVRPAVWVVRGLIRLFLALFGVRLRCAAPEAIRRHSGLVFINHLSYLDPLVLLAVAPVRFLSAEGVKRLPLVGWMAGSVGTVFVRRSDEASRTASRETIAGEMRARAYPPIALAPEGQIGPGPGVLPFRHGAFEVAAEAGVPILPVAITFEPLDAAAWLKGEWLLRALWRLAARTTPFTATLTPLPALHPRPGDDVALLARETEARFERVLLG